MKTQLSTIILSTLLTTVSAQDQTFSGGGGVSAGSSKSTRVGANNTPRGHANGQPDQPGQTFWNGVNSGSRYQKGDGVFVLRFSAEPRDQANLESDLGVMSHLLHKTLSEKFGNTQAARSVLGINVAFTPGSQPLRTAYLEGYGALFLLNVSFPLYPPPAPESDAKEKPDTDSAWEEAKREYYGESAEPGPYAKVVNEYDEQKVSELKAALLEALKSGSNIRGLRSDEHIIICVSGGPTAIAPTSQPMNGYGAGLYGGYGRGGGIVFADVVTRGSVLTLRVKKSDVDSFAAAKMSPEEFSRAVTSATYQTRTGTGSGDGSFYTSGGGVEYLLTDPARK